MPTTPYVGRFAPSPTGPLHFGSLVAAMASYADARFRNGRWLLRIEDLDPPRESRDAANSFPVTLERYGFEWDGPILYQSTRGDAYGAALDALIANGDAFACACTRTELASARIGASGDRVYPGTCRNGVAAGRTGRAWRLHVNDAIVAFDDRIQGRYVQNLAVDVGDFVIRRADGFWAYQLAVVVDDRDQGVTDVVRGADLLSSTPRQILLHRRIGAAYRLVEPREAPSPRFAHVPVAAGPSGEKLSKQTLAPALPESDPMPALIAAWHFLDQVEPDTPPASPAEFWAWAIARWDMSRVSRGPKPAPPLSVAASVSPTTAVTVSSRSPLPGQESDTPDRL